MIAGVFFGSAEQFIVYGYRRSHASNHTVDAYVCQGQGEHQKIQMRYHMEAGCPQLVLEVTILTQLVEHDTGTCLH
jgi:hypothetical protein